MEQSNKALELPQTTAHAAPPSNSNEISSSSATANATSHDDVSSVSTVSVPAPRKSSVVTTAQQHLQFFSAAFGKSKSRTQHTLQNTTSKAQQPTGANNGRQRSTSLMAPNKMPRRMTKNYQEIARDFRMLKPFTRLPDGTYPPETRCVFCEIGSPKTVFFPCQHKCVCDVCIKLHDITSDRSHASAWSACPVCMTDIRLILPYSGTEEDEYWKWISEVKPSLPHTFKLEFKDAAKRLSRNAVLPGTEEQGDSSPSANSPTLTKQPSNRRHTWHSNNQSTSQQSADPKNCSIL